MTQGVSRRSFLSGVGAAAFGAAAFSLTGCSPSVDQTRSQGDTASNATASSVRWSWEIAPVAPVAAEISDTYDCDVCILGAGSAGVPAALYAATQGLSVVVLQKYNKVQSNGWSIAAFNTKHDEEYGITYDPANARAIMAQVSSGRADVNVICSIIDKSGMALDWLNDQMSDKKPMSMTADTATFAASQAPHMIYYWVNDNDMSTRYAAFGEALEIMASKAEAKGAQFLYETPAEQLITDDSGRVVGAYGKKADGTYVQVNAAKGVLIATGDVTDDAEMTDYFIPTNSGVENKSPYGTCTGDGHKMALWAGAAWDTPPLCLGLTSGTAPGYADPALRVNSNGLRFINETIGQDAVHNASPLQTADVLQPGKGSWSIYDSKLSSAVKAEALAAVDGTLSFTADTIEELAAKAGINAENLVKTVARYNKMVETGVDLDYGVPAATLAGRDITTAPFYAVVRKPQNMAAIGGVQANSELNVVNENKEAVQGLYVAGNAMGSCYGYQYPWASFSASNKMHAMAGGILAVRSMMGVIDQDF